MSTTIIDHDDIGEDGKVAVRVKWFRFNQTNCGGYFIRDEMVCEDVFFQDISADRAIARANAIFKDGRDSCCYCCGSRWDMGINDDDGTIEPKVYGQSIYSATADIHMREVRLHYLDGRVETYKYGQPRPPKLLSGEQ